MKQILFNTEMVRAILENRKTCTRRVIKGLPLCGPHATVDEDRLFIEDEDGYFHPAEAFSPIQPLDILYVRETWKQATGGSAGPGLYDKYLYKADEPQDTSGLTVEERWHPSIHMPKKAARIFLAVTAVRAERLHDMTNEQAEKEGCEGFPCSCHMRGYHGCTDCLNTGWLEPPLADFMYLWNSTIKKKDLPKYGWGANPWVWVIEFKRIENPVR